MKWTKAYYGVQHLVDDLKSRGIRQVTVCDHGSHAVVYALPLAGFTEFWKEAHVTATAAREAAEKHWSK